jgi:hypothetical protein
MQSERIFHYTSVDSLEAILKSQKIRFSRIDHFDDVIEAQTHGGVGFGKYFFASSWTQDESESIPQWSMYGGNKGGVRIELPVKPFRRIPLESIPGFTIVPGMEPLSPLTTRELFGKSYFISPMMVYKDEFFQGPVDYVTDVAGHWSAAVTRVPDYSGRRTPGLKINKMWDLVRLKSDAWRFQAEYRFYLFAMPMVPPFEPDGTNLPTIEQIMSTSDAMQQNIDPVATYIDVPLDPASLDHLVVRTGPLITETDRSRVEALLRQFAPNAAIAPSALENTIRHPKRNI